MGLPNKETAAKSSSSTEIALGRQWGLLRVLGSLVSSAPDDAGCTAGTIISPQKHNNHASITLISFLAIGALNPSLGEVEFILWKQSPVEVAPAMARLPCSREFTYSDSLRCDRRSLNNQRVGKNNGRKR
jgi:hypothetical protein